MQTTSEPKLGGFSPEAAAAINRAYAQALDVLKSYGALDRLRVTLAEHLLEIAQTGEVDESRLCSLAVARTVGTGASEHRA